MTTYVSWLADAARAAAAGTGKSVIEQPGWQSRGHGGMTMLEGVVGHHTGTPASSPGDYPSLGTITNGRSDLPGPLAAYGLGRSGNIYVIAAGTSYHAGTSSYAGFTDLNNKFLGIEAESPGDGTWTADQLYTYPRLVGEILRRMNRGVDRYCSHRTCATPAGRKPDPTGIDDAWMRDRAAAYLRGDNVANDETLDAISYRLYALLQLQDSIPKGGNAPPSVQGEKQPAAEYLRVLGWRMARLINLDPDLSGGYAPPPEPMPVVDAINQLLADVADIKVAMADLVNQGVKLTGEGEIVFRPPAAKS